MRRFRDPGQSWRLNPKRHPHWDGVGQVIEYETGRSWMVIDGMWWADGSGYYPGTMYIGHRLPPP